MDRLSSFEKLLNDPKWKGAYFGQGNPNSDILIIGKEPGISNPDQAKLEIGNNRDQWCKIMTGEDIGCSYYSPRDCYSKIGQEFRVAPRNGGTSDTCYVYQEIVNALRPHKMADGRNGKILDFFEYSFITELSDVCRSNNNNNTPEDNNNTSESIKKRKPLLSSDFYCSFPIVILSCGKYFDEYNIDFQEIFKVKFDGKTEFAEMTSGRRNVKIWLNVHHSDDKKRVLIHTWQASALKKGPDEKYKPFFDKLVQVCK